VRVEDYHFYGRICLLLGVPFTTIGLILLIATIATGPVWRYAYGWVYPFLGHGIALLVIGVALMIVSKVLFREYNLRRQNEA